LPTPSDSPAHETHFSLNLEVQACLSPLSWDAETLQTLECSSGSSVVGSRFGDKVLGADDCVCRPAELCTGAIVNDMYLPHYIPQSRGIANSPNMWENKQRQVAKLITKLSEIRLNYKGNWAMIPMDSPSIEWPSIGGGGLTL